MKWEFDHLEFAKEIDAVGVALKINNEDMASLSDLSPGEISRLRRGLMPNVKMSTFLMLCNALDIDPRQYWSVEPITNA
jgi:DNA-binding Xre family transcriptional regulator